MHTASCHCGKINWTYPRDPEWVTECNCSICSRLGTLWAYAKTNEIKLTYEANDVIKYIWGDEMIAFVSCKFCGCTTHWERLEDNPEARMAVNFRMLPYDEVKKHRKRVLNAADDSFEFLD